MNILKVKLKGKGSEAVEVDRFDFERARIFLEVYEVVQGEIKSSCVQLTRREARKIGRALLKAGRK